MERRRIARVRTRVEVRYRLAGQPAVQARRGWSQDLSAGGLRFLAGEPLAIGQELHIALRHPLQEVWLPETCGVVTWQRAGVELPEGHGYGQPTGVSFSGLDGVVSNRIQQWLDQQTTGTTLEEGDLEERSVEPPPDAIGFAYDGSTVTYRVLRAFGWGPLNNLGYFQFPSPFSALNLLASTILGKAVFLLPEVQTRLVKKAMELLEIQGNERVLDIACGRGRSSYMIANLHSQTHVTAIDLLPENIQVASTLYSNTPNLRFVVDNALHLRFSDRSFNKALCLEAAFHFPDRAQFLREAFRVLHVGGQLVVADFAWKTDGDRSILEDEETRLVRHIWRWDDFFSIAQYFNAAKATGFEVAACHNWSRRVTTPVGFVFKSVAWLGCNRVGRSVLVQLNPLLRGMTDEEWTVFHRSAWAHDHVRQHVEYVALVLKKPT